MRGVSTKVPARPDEPLDEVIDLMRLLWLVDHRLQSRSKLMEGKIGVTGPQRMSIRLIGRRPGVSAGELAAMLHLHPSTVTGIVARLVARGLVDRQGDSRDGRRACLSLTAKGRRIDALRAGTLESAVRAVVERASPQQLNAARRLLEQLAESLAAEG